MLCLDIRSPELPITNVKDILGLSLGVFSISGTCGKVGVGLALVEGWIFLCLLA